MKRTITTICALCCIFTILFVFVGCNSSLATGSLGEDNTTNNENVEPSAGISNDRTSDNVEDEIPNNWEDVAMGPMVCSGFESVTYADFYKNLQKVGKNNTLNFVIFNLDSGLFCVDQNYFRLGITKYSFDSVVNLDLFDLETYVFDMEYTIGGRFGTEELDPNCSCDGEIKHEGEFCAEYICFLGEARYDKSDVSFVKVVGKASDYSSRLNSHFRHLFEIRANGELLGVVTIDCDDEMVDIILKNLNECMEVCSNLC